MSSPVQDETLKEEHENKTEGTHNEGSLGYSAKWSILVNKLRQPIIKFLHALACTSANNPKRTITFVITLSLGIFIIGLWTNFSVDVGDHIWTPKDSKPVKHSNWIDDESGFLEEKRIFFFTFHKQGNNVLGYDEMERVFEAFDSVLNLPGYDELCSKNDYVDQDGKTTCEIEGVTKFWNSSSDIFKTSVSSDEETITALSATEFPDGTPVSPNNVLGHPQRNADGTLTNAQLYLLSILLPDIDEAEDFEEQALDVVLAIREDWANEAGNDFRMEVQAWRSFDDEFTRAIEGDIPLLPVVFIIMSIFTCIVFSKRDKVMSRSLLGFGGVVSVLLSILSGFGLMFTCGVPFTSMASLVPFIIFGIGLDDTFIISGCYERTDKSKPTIERIHDTIEDCGLSISLTTLTSTAAFGLGCISTIPAIFWLCMYAFPTVVIVFLYQMTFFIACVALDERRIKERRRDCCACIRTDQAGDEEEIAEGEPKGSNGSDEMIGVADVTEREDARTDGSEDIEPMSSSERIMTWYATQLMRPAVKVAVLIGFAGLTVACGISASNLKQAFDVKDVLPSDSYVTDFFDAIEDYTVRTGIDPGVYFRFVDQSDEDIQRQMDQYISELVGIDAIVDLPYFFWLDGFRAFAEDKGDSVSGLSFNEQLDLFLADPVYNDLYADDIVRAENGDIIESRCFIGMDNVDFDDVKQQIAALEDQRAVTTSLEINEGRSDWAFFTYEGIYDIWEFYATSADELVFTTIMGIVAVTGVAFLLIPHWTASLFIFPMISVLYLDFLGVLQWAGVSVNPVSYVALVLSIGLMVDFLMHLLLRYYESSGTREEKTVETLRTMGASILIGGISTFLGTLPLAFSTSDIFITIFYAFLGLVTLGCGHGLILLPVVLSIIGPEDEPMIQKPASFRKSINKLSTMQD